MGVTDYVSRTDSDGYVEGTTINWAQALVLGISKLTWLGSQTAEIYPLNDAGQILIPTTTRSTKTGFVGICEEATGSSVAGNYITVALQGKHSEKFDGCFTAVGIADKNWERMFNNAKLQYLVRDMEDYALSKLQEDAIVSAVVKDDFNGDALAYFGALVTEYAEANYGMQPDTILVSLRFYQELKSAKAVVPNQGSGNVLETGILGRIDGINLIPVYSEDTNADVMAMYRKSDFAIAIPTSPKSLPNTNILGAYNNMTSEDMFSSGMQMIHDPNPASGTIYTWVHLYRGYEVLQPNAVFKTAEIPAV